MMSSIKKSIILLMILALIPISNLSANERSDIHIKIETPDREKAFMLLDQDLDIIDEGLNFAEALVNPAELKKIEELGFQIEILHQSLTDFYQQRLQAESGVKTMGGYKTLSEIYTDLDNIVLAHPDIVSAKQHLGLTYEGRDMWAVKISDNPNVNEDEPELLFTAAIHAREVITPLVLLNAMDHLTDNYGIDPEITNLVDSREIWFVLVVNPDGYFYNEVTDPSGGGMWRKNRRVNADLTRGVDLNRNFGHLWGYDDVGSSPSTSSNTYRGTGPFSEPETFNMKTFTEAHNFTIAVYFHSYSNLVLWPWGYDLFYTPDENIFSQLGDTINNMNSYAPGPGWTLYKVNGDSDDWYYGEQTTKNKIFSMTFEVGSSTDGFWPLVSRIPQLVSENLDPILFLCRTAGDIYSLAPPEAPVIAEQPLVEGLNFPVTWSHTDIQNPAIEYELSELSGRSVISDSANDLAGWSNNGFSISTNRFASGTTSLYSGSGNSLSNYVQTIFPYLVQSGDSLKFQTYHDIEANWDYAYVEVSTDGQVFTPIPGNITTTSNPNGTNRGNGISGTLPGWMEALFDLSAYVGQELFFRFSYNTDGFVVNEGFYIDDIYPHLLFAENTVVASGLTSNSETVASGNGVNKKFYHRVRARDVQNQWSNYSGISETVVIHPNTIGDADLDGDNSTIADLVMFHSYLNNGLGTFTINSGIQFGQIDTDCDGTPATLSDLNSLEQVLLGQSMSCYTPPPSPIPDKNSNSKNLRNMITAGSSAKAITVSGFSVAIEGESILVGDSGWANIQLTNTADYILGFQMQFEYDTDGMTLAYIDQGIDIPNWQYFNYFESISGSKATVTIAALAQVGSPVSSGDIDFTSLPANLARLRFAFNTDSAIVKNINFKWLDCSDNNLAIGSLSGTDVVLDKLVVSNKVLDADLVDITGASAEFGGADPICSDGLIVSPIASLDFTSGRMEFDGGCCSGMVGDANSLGGDAPTVGDITIIIELLFGSGTPLECYEEADVNLSGAPNPDAADVSVADITEIIDHLFGNGNPLADCP